MKRFLAVCAIAISALSVTTGFASNSQALLEQGLEAFKSANYKNAELLFRKCIDVDDDNSEKAWFYLARSLYSQKKYKDTIFEFNRFLLNCRSIDLCAESRFWIADSYYNTAEYIKAIEEYKRFISQSKKSENPLISLSHDRIADIYFRQQRYDEAVIEWKLAAEALDQNDRKSAIHLRIADALFLNKKYEEAEALLGVLSGDRDLPVFAQANILLGRISAVRGKPRIALRYYSRVPDSLVSAYPYYDVLFFKALSYLDLEDKDSAKNFLQGFTNVGKNSVWYNYGRFQLAKLLEAKSQAESVAVMEEIRAANPEPALAADLAIELEKLYFLQGKPDYGIAFLEEVRASAGQDRQKEILYELGDAYLSVKKYDAAEKIYTEMKGKYSFDSKDADRIQFQLAIVYLRKGDAVRAAEGFQKLGEINPFSPYIGESNYYMASAKFDQGEYKSALKFLDEYLKNQNADKRYDASLLQLRALMKLSDYAGADKAAGNIARRYYDHVGVDGMLVEFIRFAYGVKQDPSWYENFVLRNFADGDSSASIYLFKAAAEFEKQNWKKAELLYTSYLKIKGNETNPRAFINKGVCIFRQGNFAGVISFLSNEKMELFSSEYSSDIVILLAKASYLSGQNDKGYEYFNAAKDYIKETEDLFYYFETAMKNDNIVLAKDLSSRLRDDKPRYYASLYEIGLYYKEIFSYEDARGFFSRICTDYPDTLVSEESLLELSLLDIKDARYDDAVTRLKGVKAKELDRRKNIIVITAYYKMGRYAEGMELLKKSIDYIIKEPEAKALLKMTIDYLLANDDAQSILYYGRYLSSSYPDEQDFVNYTVAAIYYRARNYNKAYSYYSRLQLDKGEYRTESLYRRALINELFYKNVRGAVQLFQQLSDSGESDEFVSAGKIELSLLFYEKGQKDQSQKILSEIVGKKENVAAIIKASNIMGYYNLAGEMPAAGAAIQDGSK